MRFYRLIGRLPVLCAGLDDFGEWLTNSDRIVAQTDVAGLRVSTVFLGLDHSFHASGPPILFETMTFKGAQSIDCQRYETWDDAEAGHQAVVARLTAGGGLE